jgi:DNA-binding response OmpR family regulator
VRVLLIEDHKPMLRAIKQGLEEEGFAVDIANDGEEGNYKARTANYDVIILDLMLPKIDGLTLLQQWRREGMNAHILVLTAKGRIEEMVHGLDLGADDYLTKPFAFEELVARVLALARREPSAPPMLSRQGIALDRARRTATRDGRLLQLNRKEFGLLEALMSANGAVVSQESLLQTVWDENADPFTKTVTVTIARLRRKLGDPEVIETLIGSGYRIR